MLSVGIVGLPNVGKSTLFNALLKKQAALAANYPFATIEPNVGIVAVPDNRLIELANITKDEVKMNDLPPIKPATVEFVDIAGLVKGASEGEGLGNKFLSHIREVKIIAHVVRVFEDSNVIKEGAVDPRSDYEVIRAELGIADLETVEKSKSRKDKSHEEILNRIEETLKQGKSVSSLEFSEEGKIFVDQLGLLTSKPEIIVLNVSEGSYNDNDIERVIDEYSKLLDIEKDRLIVVSAKIEEELASLGEEDGKEYLKELGVTLSGLERLIKSAYKTLGLISFLTCGEKEVRAWTIKNGSNAVEASGEIHTDFMAKFIKAEIVGYDDFVENNGWKGSREKGKARLEGKEYIVNDGDVVEFKIGR